MAKPKRWIDRAFTSFAVAVVVLIWLALTTWLVVDWNGFWEMIVRMEPQIKGIALMLLFVGPIWLFFKLKKVPPSRQKELIEHAGVVYLRPFTVDAEAFYEFAQMATRSSERSLEQMLCDEMKVLGSVVAIGRPDDVLVRDGATRIYVGEGGDWQSCVKRLTARAKATILVAGKTPGLLWEKEHARQNVNPTRLLLVIPAASKRDREQMIKNVEQAFGIGLPPIAERLRVPRFVVFDERWQAQLLLNVYRGWVLHVFGLPLERLGECWKVKETLAPFLARVQAEEEVRARTEELKEKGI